MIFELSIESSVVIERCLLFIVFDMYSTLKRLPQFDGFPDHISW